MKTSFRLSMGLLLGLVFAWTQASLAGPVFISGDDADDSGHCQGTACGGLYPQALHSLYTQSASLGVGILAVGVNGSAAQLSLDSWNDPANGGPGAPITILTAAADIASVDFADYRVLYVPSNDRNTGGGITDSQIAALNTRQADIQLFVNDVGGGLLALTEDGSTNAFGWLPLPLTFSSIFDDDIYPAAELASALPGVEATDANMDHCCYHTVWTGPLSPNPYLGLKVLARTRQTHTVDEQGNIVDGPVIVGGGVGTKITAENCTDGIDNDADGLVDNDDPDCHVCGDGDLDPDEECDDGNTLDGDGCSALCELENSPPDCRFAEPSMDVVWPPNHQFIPIKIFGVTDPDEDVVSLSIDDITQDEPVDETGTGSGASCPDAMGLGTETALLRAERTGQPQVPGDGRVYHIAFSAEDGLGGTCSGVVAVCVPHDQRSGQCGDQGPLYDATGCP